MVEMQVHLLHDGPLILIASNQAFYCKLKEHLKVPFYERLVLTSLQMSHLKIHLEPEKNLEDFSVDDHIGKNCMLKGIFLCTSVTERRG